nr:type II toxin-antitoxin system VapB family antitoxin [Succinivibrionaceae bacterium]
MTEREDIDDTLLEKAMRIGGLKTREETVNQALREFIERREAEKLIAAFGTVDFDEGYDYKAERNRRVLDQPDGREAGVLLRHLTS